MCKILMSIKPKYSEKIFSGDKKYEFRRKVSKLHVDRIIVYSSFPDKKVIGEVEVMDVVSKPINELWKLTKKYAGITYDDFEDYFDGCDVAYAYVLGKVTRYKKPKSLLDFDVRFSPQSYVYV